MVPAPPAPPPRTTSIQFNLSKILNPVKNHKHNPCPCSQTQNASPETRIEEEVEVKVNNSCDTTTTTTNEAKQKVPRKRFGVGSHVGQMVKTESNLEQVVHRHKQQDNNHNVKPPRPKSDIYVIQSSKSPFIGSRLIARSSSRYSAIEGNSGLCFGQLEAYVKLEQLGKGSYATVHKGYSNLLNKVVALKEIRRQRLEGTPFTAIREASLLRGLRHANIVTLHDIIHTKETLTFVFEYVHTDLSQYLEKNPGGLNPHNVELFLFQLLRGLAFCHERRILHRDLKPQNLLVSEIGELKLADFGLARAKSVPSRTYSHEVVTLWYRPPDVLLGSTDYSTSLDIWGVGCIFIEMVTGAAAFPGVKDTVDQLDKIWRVLGTPTEETWPGVSELPDYKADRFKFHEKKPLNHSFPKLDKIPKGVDIAMTFLHFESLKRITADDALKHEYFSDLPPATYQLSPQESIFTIPGLKLHPESSHH